jgi:hypothetical protein
MNEQIKLPAQEWLGYDPEKGNLHGYTFEQMREFAKLIVWEAIGVCRVNTDALTSPFLSEYEKGVVEGYRRANENLRVHFGVEP